MHDIATTIGVTGGQKTRLAFTLGPIAFDHSDAEVRQIIDDGFDIALSENVAVGFHLDDAMFWRKRGDLINDPTNIEWTDLMQGPQRVCSWNGRARQPEWSLTPRGDPSSK